MANQHDQGIEQAGSSTEPHSHKVRGSVKDRLGPRVGRTSSAATLPDPIRRKLFSSSHKMVSSSHRQTSNQREVIRKRKIQSAEEAMKTLQAQQRELSILLSELKGDDDLPTTVAASRETTPQSRQQKRRINDPPTSELMARSGDIRQDSHGVIRQDIHGVIRQDSHSHGVIRLDCHDNIKRNSRGAIRLDCHDNVRRNSHGGTRLNNFGGTRLDNFGGTRLDNLGDTRLDNFGGTRLDNSGDIRQHHHTDVRQTSPIDQVGGRHNRTSLPHDVSDPVLKRLTELEQKLAQVQSESKLVDPKSPFSPAINQEKANPKMKLPPLETYDGTGDPYDHTNAYEIIMGYYNHTDAGMCKIFVTTLKKTAKQWIVSLPSGSINSWKELSDKFHERFGSNKRRGKLTASLMQIKQKNDEPLGEYVQRFRDAVGTITDLNITQALGFFTTGLNVSRSKKLLKDIMFNPPKDLIDAYERAEKFVAIEEAMNNLNPNPKATERPSIEHKQDVWDRIGPKQDPSQTERFPPRLKQASKVYTPLNTSRVQILNEIKGKSFYEPPKGQGVSGNQKYYCEYHQTNGHSTERCYSLKDFIEKNVQNGELRQYVAGRQDSGQTLTQQQPSGDRSNHPRRVID